MSDEFARIPVPDRIEAVFRNGNVTVVGVVSGFLVDVIAVVESSP